MPGPHPRAPYLIGLARNSRIYISDMFPGAEADADTIRWEGTLDLDALNKLFFQLYIIGRKEKEVLGL